MNQLTDQLVSAYRKYLDNRGVKSKLQSDYLKWLRFFLDFCNKYNVEGDASERWRRFNDKMKDKGQSEAILPELKQQIKAVGKLHDRDLAAGYDGLFLDDAV